MPIVYDKLINWKIPEVEQQLTKRDTILYALGVGLGADPCDLNQLKFAITIYVITIIDCEHCHLACFWFLGSIALSRKSVNRHAVAGV